MQTLQTLAPIFFMAGLGWLARTRKWITPAQKDGANQIVFGLLFPIMVFNLLASSTLQPSIAGIVAVILICYCVFYFLGKTLLRRLFGPYATISPFLLTTAEGGNFALPLFLSIVGTQSPSAGDPMLLDLAGVAFCFLIIPLLLPGYTDKKASGREIVQSIIHSPMVIAAFSGLFLNVTGLYAWMQQTSWFGLYSQIMSTITAAILPLILFIIGFNLEFSPGSSSRRPDLWQCGFCSLPESLGFSICSFQPPWQTRILLLPPGCISWARWDLASSSRSRPCFIRKKSGRTVPA